MMDEFARIATLFAPLADARVGLGLRDDAAVISPDPGMHIVATQDAIVQGVHFIGDEPPAQIAQKLLRCNLSDLAAMGATPCYYLLALMIPPTIDDDWLSAFASGLKADQEQFGVRLIGGDSTASAHLCLSLTALGKVPEGQALTRSGARVGDAVFVSGPLGDAALGLQLLQGHLHAPALSNAARDYAIARYRVPTPYVALGESLRRRATAAMDVSDGLLQDAGHLAAASGVRLVLEAEALPRSTAVRESGLSLEAIATGGDDYVLLFTGPEDMSVDATRIGTVQAGEGVTLLSGGAALSYSRTGYRHVW